MKLKTVEWSGMFSYGLEKSFLRLDANPITQLSAVNGSGKSSIALIIQEILYNKNIKGIKKGDIVNRYIDSKNYYGRVELESSTGDTYEVILNRTGATSKVKFIKNKTEDLTEHKVLDTYKKIETVIGRDFEIFSKLTYQSSVDILDFLVATDTNRKKFLINLFNLEKYINIGETIKLRINTLEKELTLKQGELKGVNNFLETTKIPEKMDLIELPELDLSDKEKIENLKLDLRNHQEEALKIDKNNMLIAERNNLNFDPALKKPTPPITSINAKEISLADKNLLESKILDIKKQLKALDLSDHCYVCKQPIDNSRQLSIKSTLETDLAEKITQVEILSNNLQSITEIIDLYNSENKNYIQNQKAIERFEVLSQLIDSKLPKTVPDLEKIKQQLKQLETKYNLSVTAREQLIQKNENIKLTNAKIDLLVDQKRNFLARQYLLNNDIISLSQQVKNLNILKKAFSTTGIVAFKLENLAKELENSINYYCAELSDGQFQVEFRLDGEKLNIIVIDEGVESPVETVSGGEFSRIQTAILLAVRKVLSKLGGESINLLFLDEITGVLDSAGKEKLIEVLMKEEDLNVFLITHDFQHPLIPRINITKTKNISKIE